MVPKTTTVSKNKRLEQFRLDERSGNKRIAKNTLVVYVQLMLRLLLGLYTSRLALEALGVSDYGLYSVVAGIIFLFTFISDSLSFTTVRYVNVERGKKDGDLNRVFNICHVLQIGMALLLFAILEIGGVFYIHHFLNVEPGKEGDAMFAFQVGVIACCMGIINVPFSSLFNATEKFLFVAVVAIGVKVVQLCLLFWLLTYEGNRIRVFVLIETLTMLTSFVVYHYYSYRQWPEVVRWRFVRDWSIYKEIIQFSYYNLLSSVANMARGQGGLLLINYFFGTVVNGAYAVGKTIERNIYPFASNFHGAAAPQITQSYSSGDMERVFLLTSRLGKYCLLMMILALFPLWAELDFILHIWLIKVPEGTLVFSQLVLLMTFVSITDGGLSHVVSASGKISKFSTVYSLLTLLCIPIGFLIFKAGSPAYMILVLFLVSDGIWRIAQIAMIRSVLHFPVLRFLRDVYYPIVITSLPILLCMILSSLLQKETVLWHVFHFAFIFIVTLCSSYYLGLKKDEREMVLRQIFRFFR